MTSTKAILVPIDFSDTSAQALHYAKEFARRFEKGLHLLHVVSDADVSPGTEAFWGFSDKEVQRRWIEVATAKLEGHCSDREQAAFGLRTAVEVGTPFVEIIRYARTHEIDLIVMGTHGRGAVKHLLMGSVAEQVVRQAPCAVLTVRHPSHKFEKP
ncbi:MAG: universal stress protein [Vicinamibacterales bacterium]|jgi:nucleotide-binding universal stress UspA family protein|nr:universal stress protein [Vicinamibacterales bacterium]